MSEQVMQLIAIVALGSNIPDRLGNLQCGLDGWRGTDGVEVVAWSRVYESAPVGEEYEGDFLNAVIVCRIELDPSGLLAECHAIEEKCGRDRSREESTGIRNRTLDCDVIFYGDETMTGGAGGIEITFPHPDWQDREFVVRPLQDVIGHLTPHQARLVQNVTKSLKSASVSCRRTEKMLH